MTQEKEIHFTGYEYQISTWSNLNPTERFTLLITLLPYRIPNHNQHQRKHYQQTIPIPYDSKQQAHQHSMSLSALRCITSSY